MLMLYFLLPCVLLPQGRRPPPDGSAAPATAVQAGKERQQVCVGEAALKWDKKLTFWGPLAPAIPSPLLPQALVRFKPCKMSFYKADCTHFQTQPSFEIGNRDKSST